MKLPFQQRPKTLTDRLEAARDDVGKFARSIPERLETSRKQALAVAGAATGAAAGFAFWRSRHDRGPSVHQDPAEPPTPWKAQPPAARSPSRTAAATSSSRNA